MAERYVSLDDVREAAPQLRLDANSKPSEAQVVVLIERVEAYVDAALKGIGYQTPFVVAQIAAALPVLKELVLHGVLARVLRATNLGVRDPEGTGAAAEQKAFDQMLRSLMDPEDPLTLPGISVEKGGVYVGQVESYVRGLDLDPDEEPAFTRGQVF